MAARPIWRGHLRLALVSCPVALHAVLHDRGGLYFHLINPATGNRVRLVTQDSETEAELPRTDLVKGYEYEKGRYLLLSDEDFAAVRVASSATMTVEKFVDAVSIDPIYYDSAYYVAPDGHAGEDVYAVLREAIVKARRVALSRVVIGKRERVVALMPMAEGLVAHTLHEARDITSAEGLFGNVARQKPDPEMVALATQLIERQSGRYSPADTEDRYETRLRALIEARLKGNDLPPEKMSAPTDNVVDLMAALRRSLKQEEPAARPARRKAPAKKPARKRA